MKEAVVVDIEKRLKQNEIKGGSKSSSNVVARRGKILTSQQLEERVKKLAEKQLKQVVGKKGSE